MDPICPNHCNYIISKYKNKKIIAILNLSNSTSTNYSFTYQFLYYIYVQNNIGCFTSDSLSDI